MIATVLAAVGAAVLGQAPSSTSAPVDSEETKAKPKPIAAILAFSAAAATDDAALRIERELGKAIAADRRLRVINAARKFASEPTDAPAKAEEALARARAAYDNLDLDQAIKEATEAANQMFDNPGEADLDRLGYALCLVGSAHLLNGQDAKAGELFRAAAVSSPKYVPDPKLFAPDQIERHARAVSQIAGGAKGTLVVMSDPRPAEVFVDDRPAGLTPVTLVDVSVGRHLVKVRRTGYVPWAGFAQVLPVADGTSSAPASLQPHPVGQRYLRSAERALKDVEKGVVADAAASAAAEVGAEFLVLTRVSAAGAEVEARLWLIDAVRRRMVFKVTRKVNPDAAAFGSAVAAWGAELANAATRGPVAAAAPSTEAGAWQERGQRIPWKWVAVGAGAAVAAGAVVAVVATGALAPRGSSSLFVTGIP